MNKLSTAVKMQSLPERLRTSNQKIGYVAWGYSRQYPDGALEYARRQGVEISDEQAAEGMRLGALLVDEIYLNRVAFGDPAYGRRPGLTAEYEPIQTLVTSMMDWELDAVIAETILAEAWDWAFGAEAS